MHSYSADRNGNGNHEQLLADLLLRLEQSQRAGAGVSIQELLDEEPALASLTDRDDLIGELEQRLNALKAVDEFLFAAGDTEEARCPEIPGYEILGELDHGGMSVVYLARQTALDREVAVKILLAGRLAGKRLQARFRSEAATVARLRHPNIVQIYDRGEASGVPFLTLELVDGGSLKTKIAGLPLPPGEAASLVETIARAVDYAHREGIVHRDLKPSNILITAEGVPKVTDFGLAKLLEGSPDLTRTGETPGTPNYMAPEQVRGEEVGPRADVYALGAILHEALTGRPPFAADSSAQVLNRILTEDPIPVRRLERTVPRDLEIICSKCLHKIPSARYSAAAALANDLSRFLRGQAIAARAHGPLGRTAKWARRRPATAALLAVSVLAITALWVGAMWHARTLSAALRISERHRQEAEKSEQAALERERSLEEHRYALHMKLATDGWKAGNSQQMLGFLSPYGDGSSHADLRGFEWHYLWQQCHSALWTLDGHTKQINSVEYSPDDKLLATASDDGTVKMWSGESDRLLATLRGHTSCVNEVRFAPDVKWFATASCDRTIKIWDTASFRELSTLGPHNSLVGCLAISPDGQTIAAGLMDLGKAEKDSQEIASMESVVLWDVMTGRQIAAFAGHGEDVHSIVFSADGRTLATGSGDGTVRLWDVVKGREQRVLRGHRRGVTCVRYSDDGSTLASSGWDGRAIVWDQSHWRPQTIIKSNAPLFSIAISSDCETLATGDTQGLVELWDKSTGERRGTCLVGNHTIQSLAFQHHGPLLACGSRPTMANVFDTREEAGLMSTFELDAHVHQVVMGDELNSVVTFDAWGRVNRWNTAAGKKTLTLQHKVPGPHRLALSESGRVLAISSFHRSHLEVRDYDTGSLIKTLKKDQVLDIRFCQDDRLLFAVAGNDRMTCTMWDIPTFTRVGEFDWPGHNPHQFAAHPRDAVLAAAGGHAIHIFGFPDAKHQKSLLGHTQPVGPLAFSEDGSSLASGGVEETARIWDWKAGQEVQRLIGHTGGVAAVAFAPEGKTLATGDCRGNVRLWSVASGQLMLTLQAKYDEIAHLQFSRDGKKLACWNKEPERDSEIRVWSIER